jgi:hypothetical protein
MPRTHHLPDEQVHFTWDTGNAPRLIVDSGDTVVVWTREPTPPTRDEYYELLSDGRAPQAFRASELIFEQGKQGDGSSSCETAQLPPRTAIGSSRPSALRDSSGSWH